MAGKPMPKIQPTHVGADPPCDGDGQLQLKFGHVESLVAPIRLPATAGWARRFSSCWPPATRPERSAPRICPCAGARPAEATHGGVVSVGPLPQARVARGAVMAQGEFGRRRSEPVVRGHPRAQRPRRRAAVWSIAAAVPTEQGPERDVCQPVPMRPGGRFSLAPALWKQKVQMHQCRQLDHGQTTTPAMQKAPAIGSGLFFRKRDIRLRASVSSLDGSHHGLRGIMHP